MITIYLNKLRHIVVEPKSFDNDNKNETLQTYDLIHQSPKIVLRISGKLTHYYHYIFFYVGRGERRRVIVLNDWLSTHI